MIFFVSYYQVFSRGKKRQKETKQAIKLSSECSTSMNTCSLKTTVWLTITFSHWKPFWGLPNEDVWWICCKMCSEQHVMVIHTWMVSRFPMFCMQQRLEVQVFRLLFTSKMVQWYFHQVCLGFYLQILTFFSLVKQKLLQSEASKIISWPESDVSRQPLCWSAFRPVTVQNIN